MASPRDALQSQKKSARELRQRGSDYRCCIPALAGFVSPQSIAPDGAAKFAQQPRDAIIFVRGRGRLTRRSPSGCIAAVKSLLVALAVLGCAACTTLEN